LLCGPRAAQNDMETEDGKARATIRPVTPDAGVLHENQQRPHPHDPRCVKTRWSM